MDPSTSELTSSIEDPTRSLLSKTSFVGSRAKTETEWILYFAGFDEIKGEWLPEPEKRARRLEFMREFWTVTVQLGDAVSEVPFDPRPAQLDYILNYDPDRNVAVKSRRIGWSTAVQAVDTIELLFEGGSNLIVANKEEVAVNVLAIAKRFISDTMAVFPSIFPVAPRVNETTIQFPDPKTAHLARAIPYKWIHALTSGPNVGRSWGARRVHETEVAFWQDDEKTDAAVLGSDEGVMKVDCESTPQGVAGLFARRFKENENGEGDWKPFAYDWRANPNFTEEWAERKRRDNPVLFAQEYEKKFLQSGNPVFNLGYLGEGSKEWTTVDELLAREMEKDEDDRAEWAEYLKGRIEDDEVDLDFDGLMIFELPRPDGLYASGGDCSGGSEGGNFSVLFIRDVESGKQVAEARGKWKPDVFGGKIDVLARIFEGVHYVESNNHGHAVLLECDHLGTPGVESWETHGRESDGGTPNRTTILNEWEKSLRLRRSLILSQETIEEHTTFVYWGDKLRMQALPGEHDDGVFAGAISLQASYDPGVGIA